VLLKRSHRGGLTRFFFLEILSVFADLAGNQFALQLLVGTKRHFTHTHTSNLPSLTLSSHDPDTTSPLLTQQHHTSSYPHPPLAPSTTHHCTPTSHPHPPHMPNFFVKLCFQKFPLKATSRPHASLKCRM